MFLFFSSAQQCNSSLLDTVADSQLTASSTFSSSYSARAARLSRIGWSPQETEVDPWVQVHHPVIHQTCV